MYIHRAICYYLMTTKIILIVSKLTQFLLIMTYSCLYYLFLYKILSLRICTRFLWAGRYVNSHV